MPRFIKPRTKAKGKIPGSLIFIGEKKQESVTIRVMNYNKHELEEADCKTLSEAYHFLDPSRMTWINIDGLHDPDIIEDIGKHFNISPLILEDIMNTDHRPKYEEHDEYLYITVKLLQYNESKIESEQLSILLGKHFVITFQERVGTHFESLRERIRQAQVRVRSIHSDYLAYALLDCVVDEYREILGKIATEIESIEEEVLQSPKKTTGKEIYRHRIEMIFLRKTIRPMTEITRSILKTESPLINKNNLSFYIDLNDHIEGSLDTLESYQTMIMDQYNMYNVEISNRANDIMKTLTIFASLFIPLTFVAGIYGMNFDFIPELKWQYGYLFFWGLVMLLGVALILYFKRKRWL
jgi:magnesium transporter